MIQLGMRRAICGGVQVHVQVPALSLCCPVMASIHGYAVQATNGSPFMMDVLPTDTVAGVMRSLQNDNNIGTGVSVKFMGLEVQLCCIPWWCFAAMLHSDPWLCLHHHIFPCILSWSPACPDLPSSL